MKTIALLYHDVVEGDPDSSGFPGPHAARYKLEFDEFERHVAALRQVPRIDPLTVLERLHGKETCDQLMLTFDDGGLSAHTHVAGILDRYGWKGHFFVTADFIGQPTFVTKEHIRALRKKGHVIGSHSCSHPERMSSLSWNHLVHEWSTSTKILSDILGEPVTTASVPGGHYARRVAEAASQAGIKILFTSEPVMTSHVVQGCVVFGRYTIWRGMAPGVSAGIAVRRRGPRWRQFVFWNSKKMAKAVGGRFYSKAIRFLLQRF